MQRILFFSVGFSLLLYAFRVWYTGSFLFLFIPWNLFLAWLPLYFSSQLRSAGFSFRNLSFMALWLLFFPNSPYLITDLFHLEQRAGVPLYYDLVLLFMAAWNGLLMGLLSLRNIERFLLQRFSVLKVRAVIFSCIALCGFGIYLGRYDRYNSWHLVTQPLDLLKGIAAKIMYPASHPGAWAVTILFTVVLLLIYEALKKMPAHFNEQASL
ncbi:MAG: DUF1361 domain-containing protein [Chitinophagaceae bacterium]|nr:DUF1361 domain-containing protein [Chitinophagaceae bacterium]